MIEQHFGESPPLSLGVEEELMILDGASLMPSPSVRVFVGEAPGGRLKTEMHASVVELNTDVCSSVEEAAASLSSLRAHAAEIASRHGLVVAAGGSHPLAKPEELAVVQEPRYLEMVEQLGMAARRQGVNGLHVHVGMPSGDDCVRVMEWILPWLPVLLALSANSPYMGGAETGFLSCRAGILEELPRSGPPPAFDSYAAWETFVQHLVTTGVVRDYTQLWWDVRPHPRFGTLEVRIPDQPTSLDRTVGLVTLIRGLCELALGDSPREADREVYEPNRRVAALHGPWAELEYDDAIGGLTFGWEAAHYLIEDTLRLGTSYPFDVCRCEADAQREAGIDAVCADLVARSIP